MSVNGDDRSIVFGRNPVIETLKGDRPVEKVLVQEGSKGSIGKILAIAKEKSIKIEYVSRNKLDGMTKGENHQGVLAVTSPYDYVEFEEMLLKAGAKESSLIILLDGIEDPHNLGAIMRTANCSGADGIVIPKRRSCGLTEVAAKTSAGAIEHVDCARVSNLVSAMNTLKEYGFWIFAADMDGDSLWDCDLKGKIAIVIGNEGKGVSRLVKENCDFTVSIPMEGQVGSLNASNAAAVLMYEVMRRRYLK